MEQGQRRRLLESFRCMKSNHPFFKLDGLSQSEFFLLHSMQLYEEKQEEEGVRISALKAGAHISMPAVSQALGILEEKGFVSRRMDPSDRRSVKVYLTENGRQVLHQATGICRRFLDRLEEELGEEQLQQLTVLMERLSAAVEKIRAEGCENLLDEAVKEKERQS